MLLCELSSERGTTMNDDAFTSFLTLFVLVAASTIVYQLITEEIPDAYIEYQTMSSQQPLTIFCENYNVLSQELACPRIICKNKSIIDACGGYRILNITEK